MTGIASLLQIMRRLRDTELGCPWDRQQTFASLVPHTLEEAYEVADAIEQGDLAHLPDELGDLLFQIVFYAQLGEEQSRFDFDTVVAHICDKLIRRHPHVFGGSPIASAQAQSRAWEDHKQQEREAHAAASPADNAHSALDGVSVALPATVRAAKLQRRASRVGFDWPSQEGVLAKVREELDELQAELQQGRDKARVAEELGDVLFSCINLARHLELDAETVLRQANQKFERRFRQVETCLLDQGGIEQADPAAMEAAWEAVKRQKESS